MGIGTRAAQEAPARMKAAALARAEQKRALDAYVAQMMMTTQQAEAKADAWVAERRQNGNGNGAVADAVATAPTWAESRARGQVATATTQARAWEHTLLHGTPPDEQYLLDYHARVLHALENDLTIPDA